MSLQLRSLSDAGRGKFTAQHLTPAQSPLDSCTVGFVNAWFRFKHASVATSE